MKKATYWKSPDPDYASLGETLEYVMKTTGKTRRQAKAAIIQAMKSGALRVRGVPEGEDEPVDIPPSFFRDIPTEH